MPRGDDKLNGSRFNDARATKANSTTLAIVDAATAVAAAGHGVLGARAAERQLAPAAATADQVRTHLEKDLFRYVVVQPEHAGGAARKFVDFARHAQ